MLGRWSERRLATRLADGDERAWREFVSRHGDALYLYAFHRCGRDAALAEDIRQEVLMAMARGIGTWDGRAPLTGWMFGIARRKLADEARRRGRAAGLPGELPEAAAPAGERPEAAVERGELRAEIVRALDGLPDDYRLALTERYVAGRGVPELSERLGRTYKATESLLSRARAALRTRLQEVPDDETA